jgi:hypothetical protein
MIGSPDLWQALIPVVDALASPRTIVLSLGLELDLAHTPFRDKAARELKARFEAGNTDLEASSCPTRRSQSFTSPISICRKF